MRDAVRSARHTIRSIHAAERDLQNAGMAAERRHALAAADAELRSLHASRVAAVVSKFADRRAALAHMTDVGTRAAASQQFAAEEAIELARLALEYAAEKRQARKQVLANLGSNHRHTRRKLRRLQRHQRAAVAIQLHVLQPVVVRRRPYSKVVI